MWQTLKIRMASIFDYLSDKLVGNSPQACDLDVKTADSNFILPFRHSKPTDEQINVDASILFVKLLSNGYGPGDVIAALGRLYGMTMGSAPDVLEVEGTNDTLTKEEYEKSFFALCTIERLNNEELRKKHAVGSNVTVMKVPSRLN